LFKKIKTQNITSKYTKETLTKLLYCSNADEATMLLLQYTARPISYLQYNLIRCISNTNNHNTRRKNK